MQVRAHTVIVPPSELDVLVHTLDIHVEIQIKMGDAKSYFQPRLIGLGMHKRAS